MGRRPTGLLIAMSTALHHARNEVKPRSERLQFLLIGVVNPLTYPVEFFYDLLVIKIRGIVRDKDESVYGSMVITCAHGAPNHSEDCLLYINHTVPLGDSQYKA